MSTATPVRQALSAAVTSFSFRVEFRRPRFALEVEENARREQLLRILVDQTGVSGRYLQVKVTSCAENEVFCLDFTTDPVHPIAEEKLIAVREWLTAERLHHIIADGTGLQAALITVTQTND